MREKVTEQIFQEKKNEFADKTQTRLQRKKIGDSESLLISAENNCYEPTIL